MNVQDAWAQGVTGRGIVVTILDDGLEKDHPDIMHNYVSMDTKLILYFLMMIIEFIVCCTFRSKLLKKKLHTPLPPHTLLRLYPLL